MHAIKRHRRNNFARLVKDLGGPREAAIALDMNESQVSQLISEHINKVMGNRLARKIERAAGLDEGQLDMPTSPDGRNMLTVPILDQSSLGDLGSKNGLFPLPPDERRQWIVWDNSNPYRPRGRLIALPVQDTALGDIASEGDLLIFDCWPAAIKGSPEIRPGSIVAALHNGELIVRVVRQQEKGGVELFSPSDLYAPVHLKDTSTITGVLVEVRHLRPRFMR